MVSVTMPQNLMQPISCNKQTAVAIASCEQSLPSKDAQTNCTLQITESFVLLGFKPQL